MVQERVDRGNESTSPGLAHALASAYHLIQGKTVFFGMADTIMQPNDVFAQAINTASPDDDVILVLFPTDRPEKFGMVHLDDQDKVLEIVDKPAKTNLTEMWGCIIWRSRFTEYMHDCVRVHGVSDFAAIMNNAINDGLSFRGVHIDDGLYIDLGTYEEIIELDQRYRAEE